MKIFTKERTNVGKQGISRVIPPKEKHGTGTATQKPIVRQRKNQKKRRQTCSQRLRLRLRLTAAADGFLVIATNGCDLQKSK